MTPLDVRAAALADTDAVLSLLNDAAAWLVARGITQWTPGQWRRERIGAAIGRGEIFLAIREGGIVATVSLEWTDPHLWPDAPDDAGYIHRLAVATSAHGLGIGREVLGWSEARIASAGRPFARLDCACDNRALRAYYEDAGYGHRGDRTVSGRVGPAYCGSCYEKPIIR